jgi:two-component system sensor histidine kinase YesM
MEAQKFKISFCTKLSLFFGAICVIPIFVLGTFAYLFFYELSLNSLKDQVKSTLNQVTGAYDQLLGEYGRALETFCADADVAGVLGTKMPTPGQNSQIYRKMFFLLKGKPLNAAMYLMGANGKLRLSTIDPPGQYDISTYRNWGIYAMAKRSRNVVVYPNVYLNSAGQSISLALVKAIRAGTRIAGYAIIDIPAESIEAICNQYRGSLPLNFTIVDRNYYTVYDESKIKSKTAFYDLPFREEFKTGRAWRIAKLGERRALICNHRSLNGQFFVIGTLYLDIIIANIKSITFVTVGLGLASFILCVILSILITRSIGRPIQAIVKTMRKVEEGRFDVRVEVDSRDEVGFMACRFNDMIARIDELFHTNLEKQDRLRLAEIQALQSQINPHFLYNTLDSIKWIAKLNGIREIEVIVIQLGKLLKNSINNRNEMTTVRDSLEIIDSYLTIQKIRYSDRFTVHMDIDPGVLDCYVPRLIIQPIVENAIVHGIVKKIGEGRLDIKAGRAGTDLLIEVADDGAGIDAARLEQIRTELESDQRKVENIGIHNVNRRIKLCYGEKYGVSISSEAGRGTTVILTMPASKRQVEDVGGQETDDQGRCG